MRLAGSRVSPEQVMALGALDLFAPKETNYGDTAGVINMKNPASMIGGRSHSGQLSPQDVMEMEEGPAKAAKMRTLQRLQGGIALPSFVQGV